MIDGDIDVVGESPPHDLDASPEHLALHVGRPCERSCCRKGSCGRTARRRTCSLAGAVAMQRSGVLLVDSTSRRGRTGCTVLEAAESVPARRGVPAEEPAAPTRPTPPPPPPLPSENISVVSGRSRCPQGFVVAHRRAWPSATPVPASAPNPPMGGCVFRDLVSSFLHPPRAAARAQSAGRQRGGAARSRGGLLGSGGDPGVGHRAFVVRRSAPPASARVEWRRGTGAGGGHRLA